MARVTARDWLVMDAARRGDWLATIGYAERGGNSRWSRAVAAIRWVGTLLDSADLKAQVEQRVVAFDSTQRPETAPVLSAFKSDVVELILPVLAANPRLAAGDRGQPLIAETLRRLQGTAFESIEMRAKDFAARAAKKQSLDPLSEWQSWATLCDEANRLLALQPGAKATLFEVLWRPLTNFAVFQHNEMTRHTFSQDIFRWLRAHAHGDRRILDMLDKNLACYQPKD